MLIEKPRSVTTCYHCGENCQTAVIHFDQKDFCCEGCKTVYDVLKENSLCTYYDMNQTPGASPGNLINSNKYDYLDHEKVRNKLVRFTDDRSTHLTFYVPKIHCSSCIWLLENMHRLNQNISSSTVNFLKKEVHIVFDHTALKLSEIAALLSHIGYEPLISLKDLEQKNTTKKTDRSRVIKIGIAGFCFGNIMMLSFPEYFSLGNFYDLQQLPVFLGYLNLLLALPVFFYSASGFFISAAKSIRHRYLNIDAPIALAIAITFVRSVYEIASHTGAGYLDSMSGIVFFMLIGRFFQDKTYETLSFERDYKSYFPVGVTLKKENKEINVPVSELKKGDRIVVRNNEIIPADAVLVTPYSHIDYSFITGESAPVKKKAGDLIYAGGRQLDGAAELEVHTPVSQSYLTQMWNQDKTASELRNNHSYIDRINKYFTLTVLSMATVAAAYWLFIDGNKALDALTAVLIVACPCGLLLTTTFTNGNILRILGRNKFYLKNAAVIEQLTKIDTIIFDKTGTITHGSSVHFTGPVLSAYELQLVVSLAAQSSHPLSRKLCNEFTSSAPLSVRDFEELPGKGIKGYVDGKYLVLGSEYFVTGMQINSHQASTIFMQLEGEVIGFFSFANAYRDGLSEQLKKLSSYTLQVLSGDNDAEREKLSAIFGKKTELYFNRQPEQKKQHIAQLRQQGHKVMMIGDGLNDAGALKHSDVGIAISDNTNNFSPACDAILDGSAFSRLADFIWLAKAGKKIIVVTFLLSLSYNLIGLWFAVQGLLSPVVAAILMPASSVSIVLLATFSTNLLAKRKKL